jgi:hypothetical protein
MRLCSDECGMLFGELIDWLSVLCPLCPNNNKIYVFHSSNLIKVSIEKLFPRTGIRCERPAVAVADAVSSNHAFSSNLARTTTTNYQSRGQIRVKIAVAVLVATAQPFDAPPERRACMGKSNSLQSAETCGSTHLGCLLPRSLKQHHCRAWCGRRCIACC